VSAEAPRPRKRSHVRPEARHGGDRQPPAAHPPGRPPGRRARSCAGRLPDRRRGRVSRGAGGVPLHELVMIRKLKSGQYRLYSRRVDPRTGRRRNLGTFGSRAAAEKHERAVQFFKRRG
jgi:hypothetical protein